MEIGAERNAVRQKRMRGVILKLVRQGHEAQFSRMDDLEVWAMLQKLGHSVGRDQVLTLLQDLEVLDYLSFKDEMDDMSGRILIKQIELTATGLRFVTSGRSNEDVLFY